MSDITVNPNSDKLEVRHDPTGKWAPGIMLLQRVGGFEVKTPPDLLELLRRVEIAVNEASQYDSKFDELRTAMASVEAAIRGIDFSSGDTGGITRDEMANILEPISAQLNVIDSRINSVLPIITNLLQVSSQMSASLINLSRSRSLEVLEATLNFETSLNPQELTIPSITESLIFMARKANDGEYPEIKYSFRDPTLASYRTLPPGAEYNKVGLNWSGKKLYIQPIKNCRIEVTAYYAQP